ncbi:leucyl aminopeptidase [Pseudoalteromonas xiamenensis]|uniref:leucyl aminopeptidase n=1 Tax=Pseudoalteromonas xiamenensis TaxID=882626 RepID=UPI0035EE15FF
MSTIRTVALTAAMIASASAFSADVQFSQKLNAEAGTLVLFKNELISASYPFLHEMTQQQLEKAMQAAQFNGKYGDFIEVLAPTNSNYDRIVIAGIGHKNELNESTMTKLGGNLHGYLIKKMVKQAEIAFDDVEGAIPNNELAAELAHGIRLRDHTFDEYKTATVSHDLRYLFDVKNTDATERSYQQLMHIQQGVFLARDLTSEVASEMTPVDFANSAKELESLGVTVTVLTPNEMKTLGMGALEGVGRGSVDGARLVVAHYKGSDTSPIALIGKGITFDSGGYSIKTGASIARMKSDMAGAAAALGTVKAMALNKARVNVVAVMGMAANMVSQYSIAPGDVLRTAQGTTVEVVNTDAEGRLVLSDAMWYARTYFKPDIMIDIATLTGSKVSALGNRYAGIFSADDELVTQLTIAGKTVNELVWRLPLGYEDQLKSDIADLKNIGSGGPGATTAAAFLQHFAGDTRWVHLDIAGNALASKSQGEVPAGGTGFGVRLLSEWLLSN